MKNITSFTIITEGIFDARVLKKIFKDKNAGRRIEILEANGYSSALSKVKSLLSYEEKNIILVLDTDTVNERDIKEKEDFVNTYINPMINKDNYKVFWSIPEFEIIFLNNRKFLYKLIGKQIDKNILEIAKSAPKKMLETLSNKRRDDFITVLDDKEVRDVFFEGGLIKDINDYMQKKESDWSQRRLQPKI